jgi:hypothetical protein
MSSVSVNAKRDDPAAATASSDQAPSELKPQDGGLQRLAMHHHCRTCAGTPPNKEFERSPECDQHRTLRR